MTLVGDEKEEEPSVPPNLIITEFLIEKKRCKWGTNFIRSFKNKKDYKLKDSDIICLLFEVIFDSKEIIQLLKKKGGLLKKIL